MKALHLSLLLVLLAGVITSNVQAEPIVLISGYSCDGTTIVKAAKTIKLSAAKTKIDQTITKVNGLLAPIKNSKKPKDKAKAAKLKKQIADQKKLKSALTTCSKGLLTTNPFEGDAESPEAGTNVIQTGTFTMPSGRTAFVIAAIHLFKKPANAKLSICASIDGSPPGFTLIRSEICGELEERFETVKSCFNSKIPKGLSAVIISSIVSDYEDKGNFDKFLAFATATLPSKVKLSLLEDTPDCR